MNLMTNWRSIIFIKTFIKTFYYNIIKLKHYNIITFNKCKKNGRHERFSIWWYGDRIRIKNSII